MPVDFIGMISHRLASEIIPPRGPIFDHDYIRDFAQAHERGGFDRILIGYYSNAPDGFLVAAHAAASTERLGLLLAHRPGFVSPTVAARKLATLDHLSRGRLAMHVISGGSDIDQRADGDYLGHDERYQRTDEYLDILKKVWTADGPVSHEGQFYRFENTPVEVRPLQQPHMPIYFGGSSEAAIQVGAKHAETYMIWGEPLAEVRSAIAQVQAAAAEYGRSPQFSVSVRPILGATEDEAWTKARSILDTILARHGVQQPRAQSVGSQRLLQAAAQQELHDRCLWTPIAAATGARGNTTALVGTPETVAAALLDYYEAGATSLLIRGFDPLNDALQYGEELVGRVKAEVAHREAQAQAQTATNGTSQVTAPTAHTMSTPAGAPAAPLRITTVVGNPRVGSRTSLAADAVAASIGALAQDAGRTVDRQTIELAALAAELFAFPSTAVDEAVALATSSDVLVVASPTYKATYTGLLKAFFDRFGSNALAGVVAIPMMMGGAPVHALAVDTHLHPLLLEIGASCPTRGLFILESELEALDQVVGDWQAANRAILSRLLR
ncbi:MAG: LLM class flavin-dependent oxidoreductase [Chloroflexota bacterium]